MRGFLLSVPGLLVAAGAWASSGGSGSTPAEAWSQFAARHPGWTVQWSQEQTVHRAFGQGIAVTGRVTDPQEAAAAALTFLRGEDVLTKASSADLRVDASVQRGHVWYVHLRQHHEGIPLLMDDVTVRLWEDGTVFMFGSEVRDVVEVDVRPRLTAAQAREAARAGLEAFDAGRDEVREGDDLYILPPQVDGERFRLVRRVLASQIRPRHEWILYVDAHTGEVAWRLDRVRTARVSGSIMSHGHPRVPSDPLTDEPIPYAVARIDGVDVVADTFGAFRSQDLPDVVDVVFELRGPYGMAVRADDPQARAEAAFRLRVGFGTRFDFSWDDTYSLPDERDAFTHAMHTYQYVKSLDPNTTALDYVMPVRVNVPGECNAFWDGTGINFFAAGGGCNSTAQMLDVVAHEYGHGINDKIYQSVGAFDGMMSGALHEGLADVTAAFLTDDPIMGQEFRGNGTWLRTLDNDNRYSRDSIRESHYDGLIVGGAMWELRERIGLEHAELLAHRARYGKPDAAGFALHEVFGEYLLELLVADDDDGDLTNGTPHGEDILTSFALHGVSPSSIIEFSDVTEHDVADASTSARVTASVTPSVRQVSVDPASVALHYRLNRSGQTRVVPMPTLGGEVYQAVLPVFDAGSVVEYWLEAGLFDFDPVVWPHDERAPRPLLLVGDPLVVFEDDFSTDQGWTVEGDAGGDAPWERAVPEMVRALGAYPRGDPQPSGDHTIGFGSGDERLCYVTGASRVTAEDDPEDHDPFQNDVDGVTRLLSPRLDLSGLRAPVIEFHWWFSNNFGGVRYEDAFAVDVSNDDGQTWTNLIDTTQPTTAPGLRADNQSISPYRPWRRSLIRVRDYLEPTDRIRLRFSVSDEGEDSVVEALVDDVRVLEFAEAVPVAVSGFAAAWRGDRVELSWHANGGAEFDLHASDGARTWEVPLTSASGAIDRLGRWRSGASVLYTLRAGGLVLATARVEIPVVEATRLLAPSPNPFNPRVSLPYEVARRGTVMLSIVDAAGRRVRQLARGPHEAGTYSETWNGEDDHGRPVASGVYTAVLETGERRVSRRITLVR